MCGYCSHHPNPAVKTSPPSPQNSGTVCQGNQQNNEQGETVSFPFPAPTHSQPAKFIGHFERGNGPGEKKKGMFCLRAQRPGLSAGTRQAPAGSTTWKSRRLWDVAEGKQKHFWAEKTLLHVLRQGRRWLDFAHAQATPLPGCFCREEREAGHSQCCAVVCFIVLLNSRLKREMFGRIHFPHPRTERAQRLHGPGDKLGGRREVCVGHVRFWFGEGGSTRCFLPVTGQLQQASDRKRCRQKPPDCRMGKV